MRLAEQDLKERLRNDDFEAVTVDQMNSLIAELHSMKLKYTDYMNLIGVRYLMDEGSLMKGDYTLAGFDDDMANNAMEMVHGGGLDKLTDKYFDYWKDDHVLSVGSDEPHLKKTGAFKAGDKLNGILPLLTVVWNGHLYVARLDEDEYPLMRVSYRFSGLNGTDDQVLAWTVTDPADKLMNLMGYPMLWVTTEGMVNTKDTHNTIGAWVYNYYWQNKTNEDRLDISRLLIKYYKQDVENSIVKVTTSAGVTRYDLLPRSVTAPLGKLPADDDRYPKYRSLALNKLLSALNITVEDKFIPHVYGTGTFKLREQQASEQFEQLSLGGGLFQHQLIATVDASNQVYVSDERTADELSCDRYSNDKLKVNNQTVPVVYDQDTNTIRVPSAIRGYTDSKGVNYLNELLDGYSNQRSIRATVTFNNGYYDPDKRDDLFMGVRYDTRTDYDTDFLGYFYLPEEDADHIGEYAKSWVMQLIDMQKSSDFNHYAKEYYVDKLPDRLMDDTFYYTGYRVPNGMIQVMVMTSIGGSDYYDMLIPLGALVPFKQTELLNTSGELPETVTEQALEIGFPYEPIRMFKDDDFVVPYIFLEPHGTGVAKMDDLFIRLSVPKGNATTASKLKVPSFRDYLMGLD